MRIRELLIATASIGFLFDGGGSAWAAGAFGVANPAPAAAPQLPQACVDAGVTSEAECTALLRKAKDESAPPAAKPAEAAPAPEKKPASPPAAAPAEQDAAPAPAEKAAPATEVAPEKKPAPHRAPKPPAETATPAEPAAAAAPEPAAAQPPAANADHRPHRAPPAPAAAPAAPEPAPAAAAPAAEGAAASGGEPRAPRLSKDCVAAGIESKADCDALHTKGAGPAPAPVPVTPPPAAIGKPAHKPPAAEAPAPAATPPQPAPPPAQPAPAQPAPAAPNGPFGMTLKGVPPQLVAPLFDSAKGAGTDKAAPANGRPGQTPGQGPGHQRPLPPQGPPPASDEAAQTAIQPGTIPPIDKTQGEKFTPDASQPIGRQLPPGARIVAPGTADRFVRGGPGGPGGDNRGHRPGAPGGPDFSGGPPSAPDPLGLTLGTIVQLGNQLIINSPGQDQRRIAGGQGDRTDYERLPGNRYRETVSRPNGVRIVTIYDQNGDVLRRSRFDQQGRETVLAYFNARQDNDLSDWQDPGDDLPPLQPNIAPQDYVLDADQADEAQVQRFFAQPPVESVQRLYSIDEVKRSARIRDMVRRLEIGDLTFDTGAATIAEDQVQNLSNVAQAMLNLLHRNPGETFLIEGHTDAVGSEISNLQLSDARAATVADILTDFYHIPPENLATQGYGERFLIVQTDGPERLNRRVTIRRITPLITVANQPY